MLEGVEAREKERVWAKNQSTGELDDARLVDAVRPPPPLPPPLACVLTVPVRNQHQHLA